MSDKKKNRARPTLVNLEGRVMADAKMVGAFAGAVGNHVALHPVAVEVSPMSFAGPSTTPAIKSAAQSTFQYTAITIRNSTKGTVNYSFWWGNGTSTKYALTPGQSRVNYISALNRAATISYDKSFAPGIQEQRYVLAGKNISRCAGFYLVEPTPTVGEGKLYTFKSVSNGVQLYS